MWTAVQNDLQTLLGERIYKVLLKNSDYCALLQSVGLKQPFPSDIRLLSTDQKRRFQELARMRAQLGGMEMDGAGTIRERRAKAMLIEGPVNLYRLFNKAKPGTMYGPWWFSEALLRRCQADAGPSAQARLDWLRNILAVALDWSPCDGVAMMSLRADECIPGIQAWGLPVRMYSKPPATPIGQAPPADYWKKYQQMFSGGATQTFAPWVPPHRITEIPI